MSFVYDASSLPDGKVDLHPIVASIERLVSAIQRVRGEVEPTI